jgi:hypothetical protein
MNAAVTRERAKLPESGASSIAQPRTIRISLFMSRSAGMGSRSMWVDPAQARARRCLGIVASQRTKQVTVKYGDRITGNDTLRELVRRRPANQAKGWQELLAAQ